MKNTYKTDWIRTIKQLVIAISIVTLIVLWVASILPKAEAWEFWTKETQSKYEKVVALGFNKEFTKALFEECKTTATDPSHCIKTGLFIAWAESSKATKCTYNNCTWMWGGGYHYKSIREWVQHFVWKYTRFWFRQANPDSFYPKKWKVSKTRYCTSEESSWTKVGCPNGNKHAWNVFNKLTFLK